MFLISISWSNVVDRGSEVLKEFKQKENSYSIFLKETDLQDEEISVLEKVAVKSVAQVRQIEESTGNEYICTF